MFLLWTLPLFLLACVHAVEEEGENEEKGGIHRFYEIMESEPAPGTGSPVPGGCSKAEIAILEEEWPEIQQVNWVGWQSTGIFKGSGASVPVPLVMQQALSNFMAILNSKSDGRSVSKRIVSASGDKRAGMRYKFQKIMSALTSSADDIMSRRKPQLYCNSDALKFMRPDAEMPPGQGAHSKKPLKDQIWYKKDRWYWWAPNVRRGQKMEPKGAFFSEAKIPITKDGRPIKDDLGNLKHHTEPPYRPSENDPNNPTFCKDTEQTIYARSIVHSDWQGASDVSAHDITILCPNYFTRKDPTTGQPLPSVIDLKKRYAAGTDISELRPQWLTLYCQVIYLALRHNAAQSKVFTGSVERRPGRPSDLPWWEDSKDNYHLPNEERQMQEPSECITLAAWEKAEVYSSVEKGKCFKSVENYAWLAISLYMWSKGNYNQDWSTGKCRDIRSDQHPPGTVPNLPARPVPWPEDMKSSKTGLRQAREQGGSSKEATGQQRPRPAPGSNLGESPWHQPATKQPAAPIDPCADLEQQENPNLFLGASPADIPEFPHNPLLGDPELLPEAEYDNPNLFENPPHPAPLSPAQGQPNPAGPPTFPHNPLHIDPELLPEAGYDDRNSYGSAPRLPPLAPAAGQSIPANQPTLSYDPLLYDPEDLPEAGYDNPNLFEDALRPATPPPGPGQADPGDPQTNPRPPWLDESDQPPDPEAELYPPFNGDPDDPYGLNAGWFGGPGNPEAQGGTEEPPIRPAWGYDDGNDDEDLYGPG